MGEVEVLGATWPHDSGIPARQGNALEVSSDRPHVSLISISALSAFPGFRPFGFPASRPFGFPAFRRTGFSGKEADIVVGRRARFAVTLNPV